MLQVCAVISRPGIPGGNGRTSEESHARAAHGMGKLSPVERMATSWGLAKERILTPQRVGEVCV